MPPPPPPPPMAPPPPPPRMMEPLGSIGISWSGICSVDIFWIGTNTEIELLLVRGLNFICQGRFEKPFKERSKGFRRD